MSKLTTESSNSSYGQKNIVKSCALMTIEADEEEDRERKEEDRERKEEERERKEEERERKDEERERKEESRKRFEVQIKERKRLYALGLYELEEGEILE